MRHQRSLPEGLVDRAQVDHCRLAQVVANARARAASFLVWVGLAVAIAWADADRVVLLGWAAGCGALLGAMWHWTRSYGRAPAEHPPEVWERRWVRVCALQSTWSGLWWLGLAPFGTEGHVVLAIILILIIYMGAAGSSSSRRAFVAMTGPGYALLVLALLISGGTWFLMGVLGVPLAAGVFAFHVQVHARAVDQIRDRLRVQVFADRQDLIFETVAEPMVITVDGVIVDGNQHFADLLHTGWEQLRGQRFVDLVDQVRTEAVSPDGTVVPVANGPTVLLVLTRPDGTSVTTEVKGGSLAGHPGHQVWSCRDVTARLAEERALRRLADHDHLTGVLNRRALSSRLDDLGTGPGHTGILMIDLDGFKAVNDEHGHLVGDRVLEIIADRIGRVVRGTALVGRLGGDEFMVLAHGLRHPGDLERVATRICDACRQPVAVGPLSLHISASIGLSISAARRGPEQAIAEADEHMYQAKRSGGDRWVGASPGR